MPLFVIKSIGYATISTFYESINLSMYKVYCCISRAGMIISKKV